MTTNPTGGDFAAACESREPGGAASGLAGDGPELWAEFAAPGPSSVPAGEPGVKRHRAALALTALGDETGLGIFQMLSRESRRSFSTACISEHLDIPPRQAAKQLSRLRRARLVHELGLGRRRAYQADNRMACECLSLIHQLIAVLEPA